jgi:hypothetical protein
MDVSKVQAITDWPRPRSVRALRGFLGLAGYYRRFISNFGSLAAPLTSLLKRDAFQWSPAADQAFLALKQALTGAPVLTLPDFDRPFIVECDASGSGIGAVLHQGDGAIALFSRTLPPRHCGLAAYERELIGLSQAVRHWRPYLWGRAFVVRTDHQPLKYILDQRLATIPQHHWVSKLRGYDFTIEYKPGRTNIVADALSRRDMPEAQLSAISSPSFDLLEDIKQAADTDTEIQDLRAQIEAGTLGAPWTVADGMVLYQNRLYIPANFPLLYLLCMMTTMKASRGLSTGSTVISMCLQPGSLCKSLFGPAWSARRTRPSCCSLVVSCSPSRSHQQYGRTSAWISLKAFLRSLASQ